MPSLNRSHFLTVWAIGMNLVPDERSFDAVYKCDLFFVPTLTRSNFFNAYAWAYAESDVNPGAEKVVQKLKQQVTAEYPKKPYQSL